AGNRKAQSSRTESRAVAIGADVLHHHFVEPRFHSGTSFPPLAVTSIMSLDTPRDSVKAHLATDTIVACHLRLGGRKNHDLLLDAVEDDVASRLWQLFPRRVEREAERLGQAVHHCPVPSVGVVLEGFAQEAAAADAAPWVRDEEILMSKFVNAESSARATGALGIVEHEVLGLDTAVHEVMCG